MRHFVAQIFQCSLQGVQASRQKCSRFGYRGPQLQDTYQRFPYEMELHESEDNLRGMAQRGHFAVVMVARLLGKMVAVTSL